MNKIFLTGGSSMIGQAVKSSSPCTVYAPTRIELDIHNSNSIKNIDFTGYDTLIMLHRAGIGERYYFTDWPTERLEYNLTVNVTNTLLLIQRWFRHTTSGTVFFMGTSDVNDKPEYKVPYWSAKEMIINTLNSLRSTHKNCRIHTLNPAKFEAKNKTLTKEIPSAKSVAGWIWYMIENNIAHMDIQNFKKNIPPLSQLY